MNGKLTSAERPVPSASSGHSLSTAERRHLDMIFRGVRHTLLNRGLYRHRKDDGIQEVAWKQAILLPDLGVVAFEVDTMRLPVKIEQLLNPEVAHQMQASLNGREVWPVNTSGLFFCVKLELEEPKSQIRLPRRVSPDPATSPEGDYLVPVGMGKTGPVWRSLLDTGHILVGGETGSGKSTWLNAALIALLGAHTPQELQVAVVDPKQVEFQAYRGIPHLFDDIAVEVDQAEALLALVLCEMDRRRALFARVGAKSMARYNREACELDEEELPLLLLMVDEVTDIALMAGLKSDFYKDLIRLVSKGRAFGLVVVLATQNPKAEVLNTLIRGNMSTRIAFRVATAGHSRVILDRSGAQELPRTIRGRMLARLDGEPVTLQGFYVADEEVAALTGRLRVEPMQVLSDLERALVLYAVEHLDGAFKINALYSSFKGRISKRRLTALGKRWQTRGWLTEPAHATDPRRVTDELLRHLPCTTQTGLAVRQEPGDRVTGVTGDGRDSEMVTGSEKWQ
jgi:hypothetical protein